MMFFKYFVWNVRCWSERKDVHGWRTENDILNNKPARNVFGLGCALFVRYLSHSLC